MVKYGTEIISIFSWMTINGKVNKHTCNKLNNNQTLKINKLYPLYAWDVLILLYTS